MSLAAVVGTVALAGPGRGAAAILDVVLVEDVFRDCVRRAVVPAGVVVVVEANGHDGACTHVGAAPATCGGHEFKADPKIGMLHRGLPFVSL